MVADKAFYLPVMPMEVDISQAKWKGIAVGTDTPSPKNTPKSQTVKPALILGVSKEEEDIYFL